MSVDQNKGISHMITVGINSKGNGLEQKEKTKDDILIAKSREKQFQKYPENEEYKAVWL